MPTIDVPQPVWDLAKRVSGLKNPASFLRNDVLLPWAINAGNRADIPVFEQADLNTRKAHLGVLPNPLDNAFTLAWEWVVEQFGCEEDVVAHLEEQMSLPHGAMTNPRGVIITRWREAGAP